MSVLANARRALELARQARELASEIADAIKDGKEALSTTDQAELNRLLSEEAAESRAAHNALDEAITRAQQ